MAAARSETRGIQFPLDDSGKRSTAPVGRRILAAALRVLDAGAAENCLAERDWRHAYPQHLRRLVELQAARPQATVASCRAGLDAAWQRTGLPARRPAAGAAQAMATPAGAPLQTLRLRGAQDSAPARWEVPYKGRRLSGDALARRIDAWAAAGVIEPSNAQALHLARTHPEWFDLSDRHLVLLGAGSEAGPLAWLAQWRANIVAIDLARGPTWKKIAQRVRAGNGQLIAPVAAAASLGGDAALDLQLAGCDMLTQTPQIAAWLQQLGQPLDLFSIAYLDGERHVRVSMAMDAIAVACAAAEPRCTLAWMATPTDVFAVPQPLAEAVMRAYDERGTLKRLAQAGLRAGSGGRSFVPHIEALVAGRRRLALGRGRLPGHRAGAELRAGQAAAAVARPRRARRRAGGVDQRRAVHHHRLGAQQPGAGGGFPRCQGLRHRGLRARHHQRTDGRAVGARPAQSAGPRPIRRCRWRTRCSC